MFPEVIKEMVLRMQDIAHLTLVDKIVVCKRGGQFYSTVYVDGTLEHWRKEFGPFASAEEAEAEALKFYASKFGYQETADTLTK